MVSTHLKNISQIGNLPQIGVKIKNIGNHHLASYPFIRPLYRLFIGILTPFITRNPSFKTFGLSPASRSKLRAQPLRFLQLPQDLSSGLFRDDLRWRKRSFGGSLDCRGSNYITSYIYVTVSILSMLFYKHFIRNRIYVRCIVFYIERFVFSAYLGIPFFKSVFHGPWFCLHLSFVAQKIDWTNNRLPYTYHNWWRFL